MGKTGMFAASVAALIVACIAAWAVSDTQARIANPMVRIDPFKMTIGAKQLPAQHFGDYSLVF